MATAVSKPIQFPADLLAEAQAAAANEGRSIDNLVEFAVSRYLQQRKAFEEMLKWGQEYGKSIGIRSEEDVRRIADGDITIEELQRRAS
jgi:hypothetical protein